MGGASPTDDSPTSAEVLDVSPFGPGWGLTADEVERNTAEWRKDEEAAGIGPWPTDAEIAQYEASLKREGRAR